MPRAAPPILLLSALLAGCGLSGAASPDDIDGCHKDPAAFDRSRVGVVTRRWPSLQWDSHGDDDVLLRVTETRRACLYSVAVSAPARGGATRELGGLEWISDYVVSPGGERLAFSVKDRRGYRVVVDGEPGPYHDDIRAPPRFSRDGRHVAYIYRLGDQHVLAVDGAERLRRPELDGEKFEILADGRAIAVAVREDGGREVVVGREVGPRLDEVLAIRLSPSARRYAYVGRRGVDYVTIIDGRELKAPGVPANTEIVFSPDERHFAYVAINILAIPGRGRSSVPTSAVVVDGEVFPLEDAAPGLRFLDGGEGGRVLAGTYSSGQPRKMVLVGARTPAAPPTADDYRPLPSDHPVRFILGDSAGPLFDRIEPDSIKIDPEGRVHYIGIRNGGSQVRVVDNVIVDRPPQVAGEAPRTPQVAGDPPPPPPPPPPTRQIAR